MPLQLQRGGDQSLALLGGLGSAAGLLLLFGFPREDAGLLCLQHHQSSSDFHHGF